MNVTMQIERSGLGVYLADTGHTYDVAELSRIIRQITTARNWLKAERARLRQPEPLKVKAP